MAKEAIQKDPKCGVVAGTSRQTIYQKRLNTNLFYQVQYAKIEVSYFHHKSNCNTAIKWKDTDKARYRYTDDDIKAFSYY